MQALTRLFSCCSKDQPENAEVTVQLTQQRRAMSEGNRTARIQRSTPQRAPLDISTSHSQHLNLTISTQTNSAKRKKIDQRVQYAHCSPRSSKRHGLSLSLKPRKQEKSYQKQSVLKSPSRIQGIQKVIHFDGKNHISKNCQPQNQIIYMQKIANQPEPPSVKPPAPRLLIERRKKNKEQVNCVQKVEKSENEQINLVFNNRRSPLIVSVLETIDERLSLPSCTESQIHDINRIPSKSVFFQEPQRMPQISPQTDKHASCVINNNSIQNSGIKSTKSQNIRRFEEKLISDHSRLINNKIKVDVEIYENELRTLLQEEKYLLDQILFHKEMQRKQLHKLQQEKESLKENVALIKSRIDKKAGKEDPKQEFQLFQVEKDVDS